MTTDPQDALPEQKFTFRRIFTYGTTIIALCLISWVIHKLDDGTGLADVAIALVVLIGVLATYYLIAPTGEHIARMVQIGKLFQSRPQFPSYGGYSQRPYQQYSAPQMLSERDPEARLTPDNPDGGV